MTEQVSIPERYCGPPDSANGGYTCGITASVLGGSGVEVTLLAPPPLGRPLSLERDGQEAKLVDSGTVIAVARPVAEGVDIPVDAPGAVAYTDVIASAASFDEEAYRGRHEYPTCYTCGPDRDDGDGLRIFPAPTDDPGLYVWPWTPDASLFDASGHIDLPVVWAALDCPGGQAWLSRDTEIGAVVLGKLAVVIHRTPSPGERLVVSGWTEQPEGRRRPARSAIRSESGEVLAAGRATWIVLTDEQRAGFRASRT